MDFPFLLAGGPKRNAGQRLGAESVIDRGDGAVFQPADGGEAAGMGGNERRGQEETERQVREIEAVLADIRLPLRLIPHAHPVHGIPYIRKPWFPSSFRIYENA